MFDIRGWDAQNLENVHLNTELKHKPIVCVCVCVGKYPSIFLYFNRTVLLRTFAQKQSRQTIRRMESQIEMTKIFPEFDTNWTKKKVARRHFMAVQCYSIVAT